AGVGSIFATQWGPTNSPFNLKAVGGFAFDSAGSLFVAQGGGGGYVVKFGPSGGVGSPFAGLTQSSGVAVFTGLVPPKITTFAQTATNLTLQWSVAYLGWTLQAQTNTFCSGISNNWFAVSGSTTTNLVTIPIDPATGVALFRLSQ